MHIHDACLLPFPHSIVSTGALILAENNVFSYTIGVSNDASDDGLNPQLLIEIPAGILFDHFVSELPITSSYALYALHHHVCML